MRVTQESQDASFRSAEPENVPDEADSSDDPSAQINVPPSRRGALWKVIAVAVRCPGCGAADSKALTGKRINGAGFAEQYRVCRECGLRFRVVLE
ncbi:hypothetical protein Pla108_09870 [Botrimarina colliarenosi]|uniref:Transcriptional regulator NrdR n=1 Tax=Botrimarina colliarenosi TaxID=2528001 RepID=A0A5C6APE7_9BACT|nr:hypothetical protein [Botrimarina colliarenosi]TWU00044.1 hypothetical protein Pla108_09870 [Botrimarina colliarenosi]